MDLLYGTGSKEARDRLYSERMAALFAAYPDDVDARAFYALSLLGLAHNGRDHVLYMRAAALPRAGQAHALAQAIAAQCEDGLADDLLCPFRGGLGTQSPDTKGSGGSEAE